MNDKLKQTIEENKKKFGIQGVPSYMVLAKDGIPVHFQVGFMGVNRMKEMIEEQLKK